MRRAPHRPMHRSAGHGRREPARLGLGETSKRERGDASMGSEGGLADILENAERAGRAVGKLTDGYPLDLEGAYRVQRLGIDRRVARGERVVGVKMGFTSKAKMAQMGVDDVIWGILTDAMAVPGASGTAQPLADSAVPATPQSGLYDLSRLIHPKVEPEIVFR